MDHSKLFRTARTLSVCAALGLPAACGDDRSGVNGGQAAALSAECTDPELIVESQTLSLWPPNHKFHEVSVDECISVISSCEGALVGEFIWASSDEPIDDIGDGHHLPDIGLGVDTAHACVRSERQGPKDGRVYKLGVRVTAEDGTEVERECVIIVDHDRRGVTGADSGDAYRIEFDPSEAGVDCKGNPVETPPDGGAGDGGGEAGNGGDEDPCTGPAGCDDGAGGASGEGGGGAGDGGEAGDGGGAAGEGAGGEGGNGGDPQFPGGGPE